MRTFIKRLLFHAVFLQIRLLQALFTAVGIKHFIKGDFFEALLVETTDVPVSNGSLRFHTPNGTAKYRAQLLYTKEPETIDWINGFAPGSIFWDVGANVGIYSLYAAKVIKDLTVVAIEPSIENTYLLNRNIAENELQDRVICYPFALSSARGANMFKHRQIEFGGSINAFGADFSHDGRPAAFPHQYQVFGFRADDLDQAFGLPQPDYIKIDVDGIEHLITRGATRTLSDRRLKSVLIELNLDFAKQRDEVLETLTQCGFELTSTHPPNIPPDSPSANTHNHIFTRRQ